MEASRNGSGFFFRQIYVTGKCNRNALKAEEGLTWAGNSDLSLMWLISDFNQPQLLNNWCTFITISSHSLQDCCCDHS